jgi:SAM-dependent methyltransferase
VGVDPSENIFNNRFVRERAKCLIEDYQTDDRFDLATLRMVVEHIENPQLTVQTLSRLLRPGGMVVIFTVNRWSPVTVVSHLLPFWLHHPIKKFFWGGEERDTFPTVYKMNTRRQLATLFRDCGFKERYFAYLDDLSVFRHFKLLNYLELVTWRVLKWCRLRYPENCLLAVYEKTELKK